MHGVRRFVVVVLLGAGCQGDPEADRPDVARCEQVVERIVDLRLGNAGGIQHDLAAHRDAMRGALRQDVIAACTSTYTTDQVACALNAPGLDELAACTSR